MGGAQARGEEGGKEPLCGQGLHYGAWSEGVSLSLVTPGSKASELQPAALGSFSTRSPTVHFYALMPSTV